MYLHVHNSKTSRFKFSSQLVILDFIVNGIGSVFLFPVVQCFPSEPVYCQISDRVKFGSTYDGFGSRIFLIFNILGHNLSLPSVNTLFTYL